MSNDMAENTVFVMLLKERKIKNEEITVKTLRQVLINQMSDRWRINGDFSDKYTQEEELAKDFRRLYVMCVSCDENGPVDSLPRTGYVQYFLNYELFVHYHLGG